MLNTLEAGVKPGDPGAAGLAEFKSALDDLRLRTWSLLSAVNADDPHAFQERFRAHRGTEMCRALTTDLRTGRLRSWPNRTCRPWATQRRSCRAR